MEVAQRLDHTRMILEILLLKSLNYSASRQAQQAKDLICEALPIAYREGYQRLFIDHGEPAMRVLRSVIADVPEKHLFAYLRSLLQAFSDGHEAPTLAGSETTPVEPLSPQELRIIRLLEAGLSRQEIAQELVLSTNTVKTHLYHIYQKLNVSSRAEAIEAAGHLLSHRVLTSKGK
jgi:LuxR family maltose regulon positive regulatory protein